MIWSVLHSLKASLAPEQGLCGTIRASRQSFLKKVLKAISWCCVEPFLLRVYVTWVKVPEELPSAHRQLLHMHTSDKTLRSVLPSLISLLLLWWSWHLGSLKQTAVAEEDTRTDGGRVLAPVRNRGRLSDLVSKVTVRWKAEQPMNINGAPWRNGAPLIRSAECNRDRRRRNGGFWGASWHSLIISQRKANSSSSITHMCAADLAKDKN